MNKVKIFWENLQASLWFVPGLMLVGTIIAALFLIDVDSSVKSEWLLKYPRLFGLGADGSRGMLSAIAGSMLTVATLAFSLTLNAITQASGQFTPRIFRNFMRDRGNQFVLGYFVSVFRLLSNCFANYSRRRRIEIRAVAVGDDRFTARARRRSGADLFYSSHRRFAANHDDFG